MRLLSLRHMLSPAPLGFTRVWMLREAPRNPFRFVKVRQVRSFLRHGAVEVNLGGRREGDLLELPNAGAVYATQTYRVGEAAVKTVELVTADGKVFTFNQMWSERSGMRGESRSAPRLIAPTRLHIRSRSLDSSNRRPSQSNPRR